MTIFKNLKISHAIMISIGIVFVLGAMLNIILVLYSMRQQSLQEAEAKARILLDRNMATHTYFSQIMKPKLLEWTAPFRTKEYFEPSWMSSTYAVREIHKYFSSFNPAGYYIKDAAINARSPENEADDFERTFLEKLKKNDKLESYSEVSTINGKPYLTVLRRGEVVEKSCLLCHSNPDAAPGGLVRLYGPERSFHRKIADTISVISMRIPLSVAYAEGNRTTAQLSILLAAVLALLFGVQLFLYRRFLIFPLGVIRDKALAIAGSKEQLGEKIPVPAGKEFKELADAFNEMSQKLRLSMDHLEDRVAARTLELNASNAELKSDITQRKQAEAALQESHAKLEKNLKEAINVISETIEWKGPYAPGHHCHVSALASAIAQEMGLTDFQAQGIELAAAVYDIGLIDIPIEFLQDNERLEGLKLTMYQGYPQAGYDALKKLEFPWPIADIILQHRECFDGSGFPRGTKGEEILIEARILAVAAAMEDLTTHKSYRNAFPLNEALEEISTNSGKKYDPEVVSACLKLFKEKKYKIAG